MSSSIRLRQFSALTYHPVNKLYADLRAFQICLSQSSTPAPIKNLRTNSLKRYREGWVACIFLKGISAILGLEDVSFALVEDQDFDVVAKRRDGDVVHYTPIQLKEYRRRSSHAHGLENELRKLKRYTDSSDLIVAYWLSGTESFDFSELRIPGLNIGELWFFGCTTADQSEWVFIGDMLQRPDVFRCNLS